MCGLRLIADEARTWMRLVKNGHRKSHNRNRTVPASYTLCHFAHQLGFGSAEGAYAIACVSDSVSGPISRVVMTEMLCERLFGCML